LRTLCVLHQHAGETFSSVAPALPLCGKNFGKSAFNSRSFFAATPASHLTGLSHEKDRSMFGVAFPGQI
jgi:hypothetical protein